MLLKQYYLGCLAHASYLIADAVSGAAVVVDPQRDIDHYLQDATQYGCQIRYVFLTHFHADFLAGHLELRERVGATICLGAQAEYAFTPFKHGDALEFGRVRLEILETPGHTPAVFAIAWLPGRGAPPHNHGTWAVVAGVDGPETNTFWKRLDDGSRPGYAEIAWHGEKVFGPGEMVAFLPQEIHSVTNETQAVTVSLHVYGTHLNDTGRSQFDPAAKSETPFLIRHD